MMQPIEPMPMASEAPAAPVEAQVAPEGGDNIGSMLQARMDELPDNQKAFLSKYLSAPETSAILGLILGNDALEHFMQYADPSVTLEVVTKPQQESPAVQGAQQGAVPQGPQAGLMAAPTPSAAPAV